VTSSDSPDDAHPDDGGHHGREPGDDSAPDSSPGGGSAGGGSAGDGPPGGRGAGGRGSAGDVPGGGVHEAAHHPSEEAVDALLDADLVEVRDRGMRERSGPPPEAVTAAHVLGCDRCRAVLADMRGVRGLLRRQGVGTPPPPVDLAARIAAAVAEDAARERRAARARRRRGALALAASVVVVGGLGTALALQVHDAQTGGGDTAAAGADAAGNADVGSGDPRVMASGTDYVLGSFGDQLRAVLDDPTTTSPQAAGAGSGAAPDLQAGAGRPTTGSPEAAPREGGDERAGEAAAPTTPSGLARPEDLGPCLTALGRPGADVVAVDTARWQGQPADVLVLQEGAAGSGSASGLTAWVVRIGCHGGQDDLLHYEVVRP